MDNLEIVRAYFAALDAADFSRAEQFLDEEYQLIDFTQRPLNRHQVLEMMKSFRAAMPNFNHSLSNIRAEGNTVKLTVQPSGTHSATLDLSKMGLGVIPRSQKFVIFPNGDHEFEILGGKIITERDVSPASPNRRISGMLKALGVNLASLL